MDYDEDEPLPPSAFLIADHTGPSQLSISPHTQYPFSTRSDEDRLYSGASRIYPDEGTSWKSRKTVGSQSYLRQVIADQAEEITRLRHDFETIKEKNLMQITKLNCQLDTKDNEIITLQKQNQCHLDNICSDYNRQLSVCRRAEEVNELERRETTEAHKIEVVRLKSEVEERDTSLTKLSRDLEKATSEQHNMTVQLNKMRSLMDQMKCGGGWEGVYNDMTHKKATLEEEVGELKSQLKSIQQLHDLELDIKSENSNPEQGLNAWRRTVLGLLLQRESTRIVTERGKQEAREREERLKEELAGKEAHFLNVRNKVSDLESQITAERMRSKDLKQKNRHCETEIERLANQLSSDRSSLRSLAAFASSLLAHTNQWESGKMGEAMAQLRGMEQRLEAATSRLPLLRAHLVRLSSRRHRWEKDGGVQGDSTARTSSPLPAIEDPEVKELRESLVFVREELERVRKERDRLINQLEEDNNSFLERVNKAKEAVNDEMTALRFTIEEQQQVIAENENKLISLEDALSTARKERDALTSERHSHRDQLEEDLCSARRQHAEAVLALRQTERELDSERQSREDVLSSRQLEFDRTVARLQRNLRDLETERNIMRSTLRQEGLLTSVRSSDGHENPPVCPNPLSLGVPHYSSHLPTSIPFPSAASRKPLESHTESSWHAPTNTKDKENIMSLIKEVTKLTQELSDSEDNTED